MHKKGQKVRYRSGYGFLYSAVVKRAHKDGTFTVQLYFPLNPDGSERLGCCQGDVFGHVPAKQVEVWACGG